MVENIKTYNPLISVRVLTYNSENYVLETLESVKMQTYSHIELIISDDNSEDKTIELCSEWVEKNKDRFQNTLIIKVSENTGVPANCNRGVRAAKGEWIKGIAGDDLLMPTCIEDNVKYVSNHPEISVLQSDTYLINEKSEIIGKSLEINKYFRNERITATLQHELLQRIYVANTTTLFIKRSTLIDIGLYDESIRYCEDIPLWYKLTSRGYKIYFMQKITTMYRIHAKSITSKNGFIVKKSMLIRSEVNKKYLYPYLTKIDLLFEKYRDYITRCFFYSKFNHDVLLHRSIWRILYSPFALYTRINLFFIYRKILKS